MGTCWQGPLVKGEHDVCCTLRLHIIYEVYGLLKTLHIRIDLMQSFLKGGQYVEFKLL